MAPAALPLKIDGNQSVHYFCSYFRSRRPFEPKKGRNLKEASNVSLAFTILAKKIRGAHLFSLKRQQPSVSLAFTISLSLYLLARNEHKQALIFRH